MTKVYILILFFIFSGCSSISSVIPVGKNTYRVSSEMGGQFPSWSDVKGLSLVEANNFCSKQNKIMEEGTWVTQGSRGWTPLNAELTFKCIDK